MEFNRLPRRDSGDFTGYRHEFCGRCAQLGILPVPQPVIGETDFGKVDILRCGHEQKRPEE